MPSDSITVKELLEVKADKADSLIISGDRRIPFRAWWFEATRGMRDVTKPGAEWREWELIATDDPFEDAKKYRLGVESREPFVPGGKYDVILSVGRLGVAGAYTGKNLTFTGLSQMKKDSDGIVRRYRVFEGSNRTNTEFGYVESSRGGWATLKDAGGEPEA